MHEEGLSDRPELSDAAICKINSQLLDLLYESNCWLRSYTTWVIIVHILHLASPGQVPDDLHGIHTKHLNDPFHTQNTRYSPTK